MRGNVWITFLCEGPRHAPPPALAGGGGWGGESLSPRTTASRLRYPPDLPSPSRAFSGRAFLASCKHTCLAHTAPALSAGHQPLCASLLVTFMKKGVCSLLSQSLFLCPPQQLGHPVFAFAEAATKFH